MPKVRKSRRRGRKSRKSFRLIPILSKLSRGRRYSNVLKDMLEQKRKLISLSRRIR